MIVIFDEMQLLYNDDKVNTSSFWQALGLVIWLVYKQYEKLKQELLFNYFLIRLKTKKLSY